ncbi:hypothetical protein [Dyella sp. M7H15-1]|uniref:DUF6933 domain-containing protein n=1 Tax=Dyella sp. M7H15-1 TaxID=2501295 RepID=UPI0013E8AB50|nr:hypothetical protein [Dyella sp. M7H15-1]
MKAMKAVPVSDPQLPRNRLGEWTANLVRVSRIQLVIAVSEPTRFGVVLDAAPYVLMPERFQQMLFHALQYIGIPADAAVGEAEAMWPLELAASNSRSVLGTLNQFAEEVASAVYHGQACSARELTQRLSGTLVLSPKDIGSPADRVRERFGLPPIDWQARGQMQMPLGTLLH